MRAVFARISAPGPAAQAALVAGLMPFVVAPWADFITRSRDDSLLIELHSFQFGQTLLIVESVGSGSRLLGVMAYAPLSAAALILTVLLLWRMARARRVHPPVGSEL